MLAKVKKFGKICSLLGLLVLTACATKQTEQTNKKADIYYGAGTQGLLDKEYTEALKNLLQADKLRPNDSAILNNLGMAYYFKGEKDLAVKTIKRALDINPDNSDAKTNLASIMLRDGKVDEAEAIYKKILKDLTYDKYARVYYNLGIIEIQVRKNAVTAENYFKKAIEEDDNYCAAYYQLGSIQYKRRQYNSAMKNFKEAVLGTCNENPEPHYYQALVYIQQRRYIDARIKLDEISSRFSKTNFAKLARQKTLELNQIETNSSLESHASRKVLESPEF